MKINLNFKALFAACMLMTLSACGGSDTQEGEVSLTPINSIPIVQIAAVNETQEGQPISITASVTDTDGSIVSVKWSQISGTSADLSDTSSTTLNFIAPQVNVSDSLVFELVVKDNQGAIAKARITVQIIDEVITTVSRALDKLVEIGEMPKLDTSEDIAGVDSDANGVRDDIDGYIAMLPMSLEQKNLLSEYAKNVQLSITVEPSTRNNEEEFSRELVLSYICYIRSFDATEKDEARNVRKNIQSFTANTYERAKRLHQYDLSRNGSVISLPPADACAQQ